MRHVDFRQLVFAAAALAAAVLIGYWSWNTLAPLVDLPQAEFRHAVAALALFAILRGLLLRPHSRRRRRPRHAGCAGSPP